MDNKKIIDLFESSQSIPGDASERLKELFNSDNKRKPSQTIIMDTVLKLIQNPKPIKKILIAILFLTLVGFITTTCFVITEMITLIKWIYFNITNVL